MRKARWIPASMALDFGPPRELREADEKLYANVIEAAKRLRAHGRPSPTVDPTCR